MDLESVIKEVSTLPMDLILKKLSTIEGVENRLREIAEEAKLENKRCRRISNSIKTIITF